MSSKPSKRSLRRSRRGSTTLEFALVAMAFVMLMFGVFELGRYYFTAEAVRTVTAEAVRATMIYYRTSNVCPNDSAKDTIRANASTRTPFLGTVTSSQMSVTCSIVSGMIEVTVTMTYPFSTSVPWLSQLTNIGDSSTIRFDQKLT